MATVRLDAQGRQVKKKPQLFKSKTKATPHKTTGRYAAAKKKPPKKTLYRRTEQALQKGGYY